jgi:hypothetical protein
MKVLIGFSTSDYWVSKIIRFFTRAPVSHTYIIIDDIPDVGHELYEAAWCGFRMSTREKLTAGSTVIVKEVSVPMVPGAAVALCRSWLNTPYAYRALVGEAWVQVGKWLGKRWPNPWPDPHHMFCSEAATYLLQLCAGDAALHARVKDLDPRKTDPYELEEALCPRI